MPSPYVRARAHSSPGAIPQLGIDTSIFPHQHSRSPSPSPSARHGHVGHMPSFSLIGAFEFRDVVASLRNQSASTSLSMFESPATPYHSLHGSFVGRHSLGAGRRRTSYHSHNRSTSASMFRGFELDPWEAAGAAVQRPVQLNDRSSRSPPRLLDHSLPALAGEEQAPAQEQGQGHVHLQVQPYSDRNVSSTSAQPDISLQASQDSTATSVPYISRTPASPTSPSRSQEDLLSLSLSSSSFLGLDHDNPTSGLLYESSRSPITTRRQKLWNVFTHTLRILFPTLRNFRDKSVMWMMASILAAPAVLMLTLTLPVHITPKAGESEYEKIGNGLSGNSLADRSRGVNLIGSSGMDGRLVDFEEEGVERVLIAEDEVEEEMHDTHFNKWLMAAQCALGPLFCVAVLFGMFTPFGFVDLKEVHSSYLHIS